MVAALGLLASSLVYAAPLEGYSGVARVPVSAPGGCRLPALQKVPHWLDTACHSHVLKTAVEVKPQAGPVGAGRLLHAPRPSPQPPPVLGAPAAPGTQARVPIVMYHYIRTTDPRNALGWDLSVTPSDFAAQMDWLQASGYHPVDLSDLRAYLQGAAGLPSKPIILTFDDGYADLYTAAYPILRAHGFKAVAYLISGYLNSGQNVSSGQVLEMSQNGIEIASHTFSHPDLTRLDRASLDFQMIESKRTLEHLVGKPVLDFCYPAGKFNQGVIDAALRAGYQSATTTMPGTVHSWADRMVWTRVRVHGGESLALFARSVS